MAASVIVLGSGMACPHAGSVTFVTANPRVRIAGQAVATLNDVTVIAGCLEADPCSRVQWLTGAIRVRASGVPVLLATSQSQCVSLAGVPKGPPVLVTAQSRVSAT